MEIANIVEAFLSILFVPFLNTFLDFAWGAEDPIGLMIAKRTFLLLPVLGLIAGYWASIVSLLSVVIRSDRQDFVNSILMTWWDMGRAVFSFWGGLFKFVGTLTVATLGVIRLATVAVWMLLQDFVLVPFRMMGNVVRSALSPGVPWIAVGLTMFWCTLEAIIFTFVTSPLVVDTLSSVTGQTLSEGFIRFPLFLFMMFVVLGSYAVLATWTDALKTKNIAAIIKIGVIELVALFVEVVFLYREFVDALVPWFAQHTSGTFELGVIGTLSIAGITWFGIRGMSWFLFASAGTPTVLAIIQGTGLSAGKVGRDPILTGSLTLTTNLLRQLKSEMGWISAKGEEVLGAFILPPLQIVAAAINFFTLLLTKRHAFSLPFESVQQLKPAKSLLPVADSGKRNSGARKNDNNNGSSTPTRRKAA